MLMKPKDELKEVFAELRQEHRAVKAPADLESLLRAEAERKTGAVGNSVQNRIWAWGLSAALLVLIGAVEWRVHRSGKSNEAHAPATPHSAPYGIPAREVSPKNENAKLLPLGDRAASTTIRHSHGAAPNQDAASLEESLSKFIALPASEGLPPALALNVVRMRIEQSSLQQYGLEVPAESAARTLLAEFVVGDDGLPRAIRIIP
jgi:hypothetical protein